VTLTTVDLNETGAGGNGGNGGQAGNGGDGGSGNPAGDGYLGGIGGLGAPAGNGGDGAGVWSSLSASEQGNIDRCTIEENTTGNGGAGGHGGNGGNAGATDETSLNPGQILSNGHGRNGGAGGRGGEGGGLWIQVGGEAKVKASTFHANVTGGGGRGGDGGDSGTNPDSSKGLGRDGAPGGLGGYGAAVLVDEYASLPQPVLMENTTIEGNDTGAGGDGGDAGIGAEADGAAGDGGDGGYGGAVANREKATLMSLTITQNGTGLGGTGGIADPTGVDGVQGDGGGLWITGTLSMGHTIVQDNYGHGLNCWGTIDSLDYNRIKDIGPWCTLAGDTDHVYEGHTYMGTLTDNGGPTETCALTPNSGALDAGSATCKDTSGQTQTADQRGYERPKDGNGDTNPYCDIGAAEMQGFHILTITLVGDGVNQVVGDPSAATCSGGAQTCQDSLEAGTAVTLTANAGTGRDFVGWDGDCSGQDPTCQLTMDANRSVTATFELEPEPEPDEWMVYLPITLKGK